MADFRGVFGRPAQQARLARLARLGAGGLNTDSDLERHLGWRVVQALPGG